MLCREKSYQIWLEFVVFYNQFKQRKLINNVDVAQTIIFKYKENKIKCFFSTNVKDKCYAIFQHAKRLI